MKPAGIALILGVVFLFAIIGSVPVSSAPPTTASQIARGKYLVEGVARCGDCHSPHNEKGEPIPGKEYRGTTLTFKPVTPMPIWADKAPNIAGLRGWEDEDAVKFLMTGIAYNDLPARPPMPSYKMTRADAQAVVVYLKSLSPASK